MEEWDGDLSDLFENLPVMPIKPNNGQTKNEATVVLKQPQEPQESQERYLTIVFKYKDNGKKANITKVMYNILSTVDSVNVKFAQEGYSKFDFWGMYVDDADMSIEEQNKIVKEGKEGI